MTKKIILERVALVILICTSLLLSFKTSFFMNKNLYTASPAQEQRPINTEIKENKYKYCDIIKITSKYGIKIKKVFYKDKTWDVVGNIEDNIDKVRAYTNLLEQQNVIYYIRGISGNSDNISLELELKIK